MSPDQILLRGLPLVSAAGLAWAWRSPSRSAAWGAVASGVVAVISRADAPHAGLLLAAIALGSALALLVQRPADQATASRAVGAGVAAAFAAALSPGALDLTVVGNALVEPSALLRGAVAAAAWAAAVSLPRGRAVAWLAVAVLWLPWGLPGYGAPQLAAYSASTLEEGAALVKIGTHGLAGASDSLWQGWATLAAMAVVTIVIAAASAGWLRSTHAWLWTVPLGAGALLAGGSWMAAQADLQVWRPLGLSHAQVLSAPWAWDLGPWALQLWRWVAVAVLAPQIVGRAPEGALPSVAAASKLGALTAAATCVLVGWWAVSAPDLLGPNWIEDPALWAAAAAIGAAAAARSASGMAASGWQGAVAATQWLVALAIAGGIRAGGSVAGLLP